MTLHTGRILLTSCLLVAAACGGSDKGSDTTTSTATAQTPVVTDSVPVTTPASSTTVPLVVTGATVIVANANIAGGSAGRMATLLEAEGFTLGEATNAASKVDASIVYFTTTEGAEAVATALATKLGGVEVLAMPATIPTEDGALTGGDVLLLLGNDQADKTLVELSGVAIDPVPNSGSTVVVANASGIGGSAGSMSDALEAAGFTIGTATDSTAQATESVVYYSGDEAKADADAVAAALGGLTVLALPEDVPTKSGELDGDILLVLGSNEAGKSLSELAG